MTATLRRRGARESFLSMQKERHEELLKGTLAATHAVYEIPQAITMVPPFKVFINTRVVGVNEIKVLWEKVTKQHF